MPAAPATMAAVNPPDAVSFKKLRRDADFNSSTLFVIFVLPLLDFR
jgi:hypothetical protein